MELYAPPGRDKLDLQPIEEIVEYLKETGCKVPVLLYSNKPIKEEAKMRFQKKYNMFQSTEDIQEVKTFCRMQQRAGAGNNGPEEVSRRFLPFHKVSMEE